VEDRESSNSCAIDEIPSTLGFNSQMRRVEDVESPNSCAIVKVDLDDIPSTTSFDSKMLCSCAMEVSPCHVIFDLNKVVITTCFDRGSHIIIFWRNALFNSRCIFGLQPTITISIIIWIKFSTKHEFLYMLLECLIKSFACEICVSYQINLTSQFSTRTLMFSFLLILTLTLVTCCL